MQRGGGEQKREGEREKRNEGREGGVGVVL